MINLHDDKITRDGKSKKETLRLLICGSLAVGKRTLISSLILESRIKFECQVASLEHQQNQFETQSENICMPFEVKLQQEYETESGVDFHIFQSIHRHYILADISDHNQNSSQIANIAGKSDLAIILTDASKGLLDQARWYCRVLALMGIRHIVLAVNKMDLVNFSETIYNQIVQEFTIISTDFSFLTIQPIPLSCISGCNLFQKSSNTLWYKGLSLMSYLDLLDISQTHNNRPFRMSVQSTNDVNHNLGACYGMVTDGKVCIGDAICILPSGLITHVKSITSGFRDLTVAHSGEKIILNTLEQVDIRRGDVLVAADKPPEIADQFEVTLLWMHHQPMTPGRSYLFTSGERELEATVTEIKYKEDIITRAHLSSKILSLNEKGNVNISINAPLVFEPFCDSRELGKFILRDKLTFETVAVGIINFALRRSSNIHWQATALNKVTRSSQKLQKPKCIWFTGLSGSGKSTLANMLEKRLYIEGKHSYLLDGDNVRHGLNRDLGFSESDRVENIRRVAEVAKLMLDAGLIVITAFISPFRSERLMARNLLEQGEFIEVFVDTPISECEKRDVKGLYAKARMGNLKNFTGIDSPYELPEAPEIHLLTTQDSPENCIEKILGAIDI